MKKLAFLIIGLCMAIVSYAQEAQVTSITNVTSNVYDIVYTLTPTNEASDWSLIVQYEGDFVYAHNYNHTFISGTTDQVEIYPSPAFNPTISAGQSIDITMRVTHSAAPIVSIISFTYNNGSGNNDPGSTSNGYWVKDGANLYPDETITGNVGIGTTAPHADYKLTVDGGIITNKIKIAEKGSTDWPDYVFASDYKLMTLTDVETFINENHHLPNVPSAKEVQENGQDLSQMNKVLLEKVEELTLYNIQLKKELDALKKDVEALK